MTAERVVVRADGSTSIGMGHVMRCLALAHAVGELGGEVRFVCRDLGGVAAARVRAAGFAVDVLPDDEQDDAGATLAACTERSVVLVDHYGLGPAWWAVVRDAVPLAAIDDVGRPGLGAGCDLVLNQNVAAPRDEYAGGAELLLGCRYALLRPSYVARLAELDREHPAVARTLLVTLGGADPADVTSRVVQALVELPPPTRLLVVQGPAFVHTESLAAAVSAHPRAELVVAPADLVDCMVAADLAVTAGGSTSYELAALGLPALTVQIADNQAGICRGMEEAGASEFLGVAEELDAARVLERVTSLAADRDRRRAMSVAGRQLVDGQGALRVAARLLELAAD